jgi:hypothetical protein
LTQISRIKKLSATEIGFDLLQGGDAFGFQVATPGFGEQGFSDKAILDAEGIPHCCAKVFFNLCG